MVKESIRIKREVYKVLNTLLPFKNSIIILQGIAFPGEDGTLDMYNYVRLKGCEVLVVEE